MTYRHHPGQAASQERALHHLPPIFHPVNEPIRILNLEDTRADRECIAVALHLGGLTCEITYSEYKPLPCARPTMRARCVCPATT